MNYAGFQTRLDAVQPAWRGWDQLDRGGTLGPRWELLREFQEEWGFHGGGARVWQREDVGPREQRRELFASLRGATYSRLDGVDAVLPIPAALDEWWELPFNSFVENPRLYWTHPVWPPTTDPALELPSDHPIVAATGERRLCVFMTEYEECNHWAYPAAFADLPDPPVLVDTSEGWQLQARTMSEFFLAIAVTRLPGALGFRVAAPRVTAALRPFLNIHDPLDPTVLMPRVSALLRPMGLLHWREMGAETTYFGGEDVIVAHDARESWMAISARSHEALAALGRSIGADLLPHVRAPGE